jgi:hypothetical protein
MNKYFIQKNPETLEVYVSLPLEKQPENSVPFFETNFHKTVFDKFPNPTTVIEGGEPNTEPIKEEPPQEVLEFIETLKQKYNL